MDLGQLAEDYVGMCLRKRGLIQLANRFRVIGAELDLVFANKQTMFVVEVKFRNQLQTWQVEEFLPEDKKIALTRGLLSFLKEHPHRQLDIRFDLALVTQTKRGQMRIAHYIPGCFSHEYYMERWD